MKSLIKQLLRENLLNEKLNYISLQDAVSKKFFGPVYHGSTQENLNNIKDNDFVIPIGNSREKDVRNGYDNKSYGNTGALPPIHHLGYGVYFTTVKAIAKQYNGGTTKGLKEYYLDIPRIEEINFASPKNMMKWWISNGYDPELAKTDRVEATKILTDNLKQKFDAVYFKGKSMSGRLLDGNQIVVFDTNNIYQVDKTISKGKEIGSTVVAKKDILSRSGDLLVVKGTKGIIKSKNPAEPMRTHWKNIGHETPHWTNDSENVYTVQFKKGGTQYNILDDMIEPFNNL